MKAVKVKTKPKGAPWWPNGLGLQAFNSWGPGSIPGPETEILQAKQLRKTKKNENKTTHAPGCLQILQKLAECQFLKKLLLTTLQTEKYTNSKNLSQ